MGGAGSRHGRREMKTFLLENLKERDHSEDTRVDEKKILERVLWKWDGKVWTGCNWLRIGSSDGLL
jgi:hypothetical protein